jgi:hypothetical protein
LPHSRVAVDAIKGYFYQFDHYILQLLELPCDSDSVCIEGVEDIDVNTNDETIAIQCKYYAGTEYNHSIIGKPIRLMLKHYAENRGRGHTIKYVIYGHYSSGQDKLPHDRDLQFFKKNFFTYSKNRKKHNSHEELGLSDEELIFFTRHLAINIEAPSFEEQELQILERLKKVFSTADFEAEFYYYSTALQEVKRLATMKNDDSRVITKREFLSRINKRDMLFNIWFIRKKGTAKYYQVIKKQWFSIYNISPVERFFLIDCDQSITSVELKTILQNLSKKWSKLSLRTPNSFCPYVYMHNISSDRLREIKVLLQQDDFYFIDGYDFMDADFSVNSICRKATSYNNIKLKIINKKEQIDNILTSLHTIRELYQFFTKETFYDNATHTHIKIPILETRDVRAII